MPIKVDSSKCIGCGACTSIVPEVFKLVKGKSVVIDKNADKKKPEKIKETIESCPVGAISLQ